MTAAAPAWRAAAWPKEARPSGDLRPALTLVSVDVGARRNGLASVLARLLEENLASAPTRRAFDALRAVVAVRATDAGVAVTLVFRNGTAVLYEGVRGDADLVIEGDAERVLRLALLTFWRGLPDCFDAPGRAVLADLARGRVRIRGMLLGPLLLARVARVLSVNA